MECYSCNDGSCSSYKMRGFLTREEKIQMLKDYKDALEKEAQGVTEKITEMESR